LGSDFIYSFLISAARISSLFKNPSSLIEIIEKDSLGIAFLKLPPSI
jgi:hypothetical protein